MKKQVSHKATIINLFMIEIIRFFNVDLLNSLVIYLLTSSFIFLSTYLKSNGDFKTSIKSTLVYILLSPVLIPLVTFLFNYSLDFLSKYGVDKLSVSNFLFLKWWNIETIGKIYFNLIVVCSILLLIFIPFRLLAGDSLKDILYLIFFLFIICVPIIIIFLYFSIILFTAVDSHIIIPTKAIYFTNIPLAIWIFITFIALFVSFIFVHLANKYLR